MRHFRRRIGLSYCRQDKADADESAQKALSIFSEAYWPPLYTFVRRRGYSPADAQDIVQGFFEHLFKQNALSRADQEKGRLRTFLLSSLQNFMHGSARPGPGFEAGRRPTGGFARSTNCRSRGGNFGEPSSGRCPFLRSHLGIEHREALMGTNAEESRRRGQRRNG